MTAQGLTGHAPLARAQENDGLDGRQALDRFLRSVERRALRMATISTGSVDDALDLVQDAMLRLSTRYAGRPPDEWGPLFQRILQNGIRDWHRRQGLRRRWQRLLRRGGEDDPPADPVDALPDREAGDPARRLGGQHALRAVERAIHALPLRQQQAFLLRAWEGLDVAETARAMGCSQGSVKTHYARAMKALRRQLEEHLE